MFGVDSIEKLDGLLNELYSASNPPVKLYGILMRDAKSFGGRQDVLLGNTTTYNLRSGADFHILVSGWDFNLDTISEDSERPKFGETYFNETAFLKIEEAIKKRLGSKKWLGYGGGYQIILIVKEQLGTNWKGAVVVDLENLIQN
jgi:hypothetical protein